MAAILDDMLTFARSDQNDVGFERLSLPSLLTAICDNLVDQDKDAVFESGGRMTVIGDPTSLKRGFLNLIENATKYGLRARSRPSACQTKGGCGSPSTTTVPASPRKSATGSSGPLSGWKTPATARPGAPVWAGHRRRSWTATAPPSGWMRRPAAAAGHGRDGPRLRRCPQSASLRPSAKPA